MLGRLCSRFRFGDVLLFASSLGYRIPVSEPFAAVGRSRDVMVIRWCLLCGFADLSFFDGMARTVPAPYALCATVFYVLASKGDV